MFSWGLSCYCPCRELQPTSASSGDCPMPLCWSLDLLWALWGQLRFWSGPTRVCACPQSPQLPVVDHFHFWEYSLSFQIFHRHRVYLADYRDLICRLCNWWKDLRSSFLVAPPLGLSCVFTPIYVCGPPTGVCSWGCPGGLGSSLVRTVCGHGMTAWTEIGRASCRERV